MLKLFKALQNTNLYSKIIYLITISIMFCYVFYQLRYSVVANDDMQDFICLDLNFYHGRFFTTLFQYLFIKKIPELLNINYQEFAIISQTTIKSFFIIFCTIVITSSINFFPKTKNYIQLNITNILVFLLLFALIYNLKFIFGIEVSEFFYGYIFPIPFFIIFLNKTFKYFVLNKKIKTTSFILYALLTIFLITTNEGYNIASITILGLILLKKIWKIKKEQTKISQLIILIFISIITMFVMYQSSGFDYVTKDYDIGLIREININNINNFLIAFSDRIIKNINFLWITLILAITINILRKNNRFFRKKILIQTAIIHISFLAFFCCLFFLGETFTYENYHFYNVLPKFWILQPGLLISYYAIIIYNILFCISYFNKKTRNKNCIFTTITIILLCSLFIKQNFEISEIAMYERKKILYIADKLSVFYFSRGETATLPTENINLILPTYQNSMPKDLEDKTGEAYKNKIYENILYFKYLEKNYKVDTKYGCKFKDIDTAIKEYKDQGGELDDKELQELNFKNIKKEIVQKKH